MKAYIKSCPVYQRKKLMPQPAPPLRPLPVPSRSFEFITLDWLGGFNMNKHGHNSVLNIICKFCKWAIVIPCNKQVSTAELCDLLYEKVFSWIGLPLKILGDHDTRLTASQMRALCQYLGTRLIYSTTYHPQTDGQSENFHKTLLSALRAVVNKYHSNWEECISSALYAYHTTQYTVLLVSHLINCCLVGRHKACVSKLAQLK
jgi:transposase InsO family protein